MGHCSQETVQTNFNKTGLFSGIHWTTNSFPSSFNVSSPICYTKTHYFPKQQKTPEDNVIIYAKCQGKIEQLA